MQSLSVEMILEVRGQGFKEVLILFFFISSFFATVINCLITAIKQRLRRRLDSMGFINSNIATKLTGKDIYLPHMN